MVRFQLVVFSLPCGKLNRLNLKRMEIHISIGLQSSLNEQVLSIL